MLRSNRTALICFVLCIVGYLIYVWQSSPHLPDKVASHFGMDGKPNGWMLRSDYVLYMGAAGVGLPLFILAIYSLLSIIPKQLINVPNRDYWFAPERRAETAAWLRRH